MRRRSLFPLRPRPGGISALYCCSAPNCAHSSQAILPHPQGRQMHGEGLCKGRGIKPALTNVGGAGKHGEHSASAA